MMRQLLFGLVLIVVLGACGSSSATRTASPATSLAPSSATPTAPDRTAPTPVAPAAPSATPAHSATALPPTATAQPTNTVVPTAAAGEFVNPVYPHNFPDPFVLRVGNTYYAYSTNTAIRHVPTMTSTDLVHWKEGRDAMPEPSPWATRDFWAPEVLRLSPEKYLLYYTGRSSLPRLDGQGAQCVGVAVGSRPEGPFVDKSKQPLVCQVDQGGTIDASPFRDKSGQLYLLYKNDGNCCGDPTRIYSQRLSPDGLRLVGDAKVLEVNEPSTWEGNVVEAPTMWREGDRYYLFYTANDYASQYYSIGYATCKSAAGPCQDAKENPIVTSRCDAAGPGHQTIIKDDDGETWLVYHAWAPYAIGSDEPGRSLWIDRLQWRNGKPVVNGPTCTPQPVP